MNITTLFTSVRCKIRTQNGTRCKMMTKNDNQLCQFHSHIQISDCSVCMEQMLQSDQLLCGHPVCRSCLGSMRDTRCPLCRREIQASFIRESDKEKMKQRYLYDRTLEKMEEERQEEEREEYLQGTQINVNY